MAAVNLYSDTQTRPTPAMRRAMAEAEVGDEQRGADPTTNALQERVAELLGHEAAVFLPTGTMCNEIALRLHVRPGGDEILLHRTAHPLNFEAGGPAQLSGAILTPLDGDGGIFTAAQVQAAIRPKDRHAPRTRVVSVEQTTNMGGGRVWPVETVHEILAVARKHDLRAHLDGARLMNAVVACGVSAADYASGFDTAWIDFTKGLGAPVGACLAGSHELIDEAWRWKQMFGGAMRQSGVIAAAALYALDHHVDRLADDHALACTLAEGLAQLPGVQLDLSHVETNILIFGVPDAPAFCAALEEDGVTMIPLDATRVRAVTHLDVDRTGIEHALEAARRALAT
ncbi:MAG: threonine aldolase [Solirubrobacteraceae bacterium]|nr:threonine aldolase [Solirubrobacteraceae bacterium]